MRVEVIMPQMGESIVEGTIVGWMKSPGDAVKRDEDILTISTDKVDADIPSPAEGVLQEILVDVGTTVEVGTVVAYIETDASAAKDAAQSASASAPARPPAASASPPQATPTRSAPARPPPAAERSEPPRSGNGAEPVPSIGELRRTRSTPLVRKIAREHGIQDLSMVPGTGVSGRVTKQDIIDYVEQVEQLTVDAPTPARRPGATVDDLRAAAVVTHGQTEVIEVPGLHVFDHDRVEPMSRMRKSIADHMVLSRRVSPHVQTIWECDWTRAMKARTALKGDYERRGIKLTYTAFLVAAAAQALRAHPIVNASVDGNRIVYRGRINIGVAVALDDGLIVPVVRDADELSLLGLARSVNDLAERARDKRLKPDEVEGGTFTITNPGVFGSLYGIPIINQPQVAILGAGAIKKRVVAGEDDSIRVAPISIFCLSFDHRIVDGATADRFMQSFVGFIEHFDPAKGSE